MDSKNQKQRNNPGDESISEMSTAEEKYRIVAENTYDMERWILPDKTLAYISPSCERITGYTREEFMTNPDLFGDIVHPEDNAWFKAEREIAFAGKSTYQMDRGSSQKPAKSAGSALLRNE
jgi:PAS domain S-box-containing protein